MWYEGKEVFSATTNNFESKGYDGSSTERDSLGQLPGQQLKVGRFLLHNLSGSHHQITRWGTAGDIRGRGCTTPRDVISTCMCPVGKKPKLTYPRAPQAHHLSYQQKGWVGVPLIPFPDHMGIWPLGPPPSHNCVMLKHFLGYPIMMLVIIKSILCQLC